MMKMQNWPFGGNYRVLKLNWVLNKLYSHLWKHAKLVPSLIFYPIVSVNSLYLLSFLPFHQISPLLLRLHPTYRQALIWDLISAP